MKNEHNLKKIKAIMEYYSLNQSEMAERSGILQTNLSEMFRGKRACGDGIINKIHIAFPEINTKWLFSSQSTDEPMLKQTPHNNGDITITDIRNSNITNVGHGNNYQPQQEPTNCCEVTYPVVPTEVLRAPDVNIAEWLEENIDRCKKIDLHKLIGNISHVQPMTSRAMEPRIPEGALLFMREVNSWDEALLDGSIYGVDVNKPHMIVRKVYDEGEFIRCEPINPEFGAVRVPKSKVMNLYKIRVGLKVFE